MRRRQIPANLNYDVPNAKIKLDEWNLKVPRSLTPWPANKPLRTSINNFGYGGTNAHVILEAAPSNCTQTNGNGANFKSGGLHKKKNVSGVFIISARDGNAARTMAVNLATHLQDLVEAGNDIPMGDLAYTLADRRSRMDHVVVVRASSPAELADRLHDPALKVSTTPARKPRLGFVFNGQGAQWHAMGRELLDTYPIFASAIQEADAILRSYGADWSLRDELMRDAATTRVSEIHLSQPITVALQICLVQLLASWGLRPSAVVSHSSGEIAAGVAAGALSVREALGVVYLRGQLARKYQDLSPSRGAMAAAGIGPDDAARYIASLPPSRRVVVACVNSPESVTLSGDADGIDKIMSLLDRDGVFARKLKVTLAYHSHHMLPMAPEYAEQLRRLLPPKANIDCNITFSSPVTGGIIDPAEGLSPNHWVTNLTSPVLFSTAFEAISDKVDTVVEIGPHSTLSGPIRQISKGRGEVRYVSCLKRGTNAVETMQDLTCALLAHGYPMSLSDINKPLGEARPRFVPDLPAYVWNHSTRYWVESRINQDTRNKRFPPHELIGSPVSGGSPLIPEWRNFLRLADVPWLADHRVDSQTVLPGAAYISMAIEAAALVSKEAGLDVHGYLIRDADFISALTIPESAAVELRLRLEPVDSISGEYDFRISSLGPLGIWAENSQGRIVVITQLDASRAHKDEAIGEVADGGRTIDVGELLARMRDMAIEYGPSFQNLTSGRSKETRSVMNLRLSEVTANGDSYIIHPTTLDCIVQATYAALSDELTKTSIVLPRSVHGLFVPSSLQGRHVEELVVSTNLKQAQQSGVSSEVTTFNAADNASQSPLRIGRLFCQAIPRIDIEIPADAGTEVLRYKSTWTPDVLYSMSEPSIESTMHNTLTSEDIAFERKMIRASYYFVVTAIGKLEKDDDMSGWTEKARVLFEWMKSTIMRGERGEFGSGSSRMWLGASPGMKQALFDEIKRGNSRAQLLHRVGSRLAEMVRSPVASQELPSLEVDSLSRDLVLRDFPIMTQIIKVIKRITLMAPGAKVLEIGAGSGSVAEAILEALSPTKTRRATLLELYCLCEPLPQLLDAARQKLARWGDLIDFRNHDMNRDLVEGLGDDAIGSFDLVILPSMSVDHFGDPRKALAGIARLLRPAGKLMFVEPSQHKLDQQLLSTFLPRWPSNIGVSTDASRVTTWVAVLRESGFTSDDLRLEDCEQAEFQNHSLVLTTLALPPVPLSSVHLVTTETVPAQWIKDLVAVVRATGSTVEVEKWDTSFSVKEDGLYIFTGDMDTPCLESLDQASFSRLQELLKRSAGILWLSCGGLVDSQSPLHAQSQGFLRTLRLEDPSKRLIHLDFELSASGPWTADNTGHVARVLQYSFHESVRAEETDWEFAVKDNVLHVQRVYFEEEKSPTSHEPVKRPFHGSDDLVVWQPARSIFLSGDTSLSTGIPAGMVDIEVRGFDPQPYYTSDSGNESVGYHRISGIVKGVRPDSADFHKLRVGDRVGGIASGPIANVTRVAGSHIIGIPSAMSFVDAVCVPTAYATAYHALYTVVRLRCGASVLIHNASEHVSQAAIVVAQHLGANVFAITHDEASAKLLVDTFSLSSDHVFSATNMSLGIQIQDKAVDVVFGTSTMPRYGLLQGALTRFGRLVWVGNDDVFSGRAWGNMHSVGSSTSYSFLDMGEVAKYDHNAFRSALEASMRVYSNAMSNVPSLLFTAQYPASRVQEAVRLQEQKNDSSTAAVIIVAEPDDLVDVIVSPKITSLVKPQSTYLIVGGLGGIGREICSWMMGSGARNVLLVSRNAEDHPEAKLLMEIAGEKQCKLLIKNCDVSSERQLAMLLTDVETTMPPIDGVIHAGMVLEDSIFERMMFDQWKTRDGVQGSSDDESRQTTSG
ncbi:hypothetical protein NPX13_g9448 [Xylaria arbuscula]|uniref:PKS/mFAS DH domain-containing protein n=1 Tax=Xylaria arbuscula TaxID=114810 RepID=A0A9W8N6I2_9PEZI|nr:hypothetical protein NPX13_g9448 [Xylaria arbuscula]